MVAEATTVVVGAADSLPAVSEAGEHPSNNIMVSKASTIFFMIAFPSSRYLLDSI